MLELVLITGMSGSGKTIALHALEDLGFFCIDNLPPNLLMPFLQTRPSQGMDRIAIAVDVRSASTLHLLPKLLPEIRSSGCQVRLVFLDASTETLIKRFSETRRKHPLSNNRNEPLDHALDLGESIERERQLLGDLRDMALVIDTTHSRSTALQLQIRQLLEVQSTNMTLVFESFAFKKGIPVHADYVFDVRMLPNPHYEPELSPLTGLDAPVAHWLQDQPPVLKMIEDIDGFLKQWLPALNDNNRSYVTVALGCTGGQHRSVFIAKTLNEKFSANWPTLIRHRDLQA
ncbi:MAG: RNase adapter RapZ [Betaproteobacteria bacterium]|jgi:RNase adapter protein RapZ|nr:RNase adapter RapZ [Betaproteobacteria bacterium]